ncbi:hypothetical protein OPV22_006796 [Ensete ventricosum]|uniref:PARP-type domain-containing protein n=1 Tax=Ensete ventricosum TaxID=4639 RepID=A0AAV8RRX1_ENSVE|nr:hypothetical protein OPV22_006796 [Ensete ventricosum]
MLMVPMIESGIWCSTDIARLFLQQSAPPFWLLHWECMKRKENIAADHHKQAYPHLLGVRSDQFSSPPLDAGHKHRADDLHACAKLLNRAF